MFSIVHSLVLLRDANNFLYFLSLAFIPLSFIYAGLGYYAVSVSTMLYKEKLVKNIGRENIPVTFFKQHTILLLISHQL